MQKQQRTIYRMICAGGRSVMWVHNGQVSNKAGQVILVSALVSSSLLNTSSAIASGSFLHAVKRGIMKVALLPISAVKHGTRGSAEFALDFIFGAKPKSPQAPK
jgi:hypothetical protein